MAAGLFAAPLALLAVARAADWYPGNGAAMSAPSAELYLPSPELLAQCGVIKTVKKTAGGDFTTIQDAVNSLNTTLSTNTCVVVTDAGTYSELVTVQNFLTNGNRLKIMKDPLLVNSPVLNAFGGLAGFQVRSASVTIAGINITAGGTLSYGIHVSSSHVLISSVNVTGSSFIDTAGIALSSWSVVENSSVSVQSANAIMAGGVKNEIRLSTMAASTMTGYALQLSGTSSNTVTGSYIFNQSGQAARLYWGSNYNTISNSTITSLGSDRAMYLYSASSNTFTNNYIYSQSGPGATLEQNSYFNRFSGCSVTGNSNSYGALYVSNSSSNTFSLGYIANPGGIGADLYFGAGANTISLSTITSRAAGFQALRIESNVLNSVLNSYIQGSTAAYVYNASSAAIRGSVLVSTWTGGVGLMASQSSLFVTTSSVAGGPGGQAIYVAANSFGKVELTSNTITGGSYGLAVLPPSGGASLVVSSITFQALLPGATAIHIYSGTNVYNLTAPRFDSPSIAVNINASAMTGGAVTVTYPAGPMASQYLANDPDGRVQWPWPYAQSLLAVGTVTINVGIGTVGALGYEVMASTADNYHVRIATATRQQLDSLTLSGLAPNTTYYVAAGALWDRTTYYYPTDMTPVTLIEEPTTVYIDEVGSTTIVASAYAPGAAFTGLERGLSGVNLTTTVAYGAWSAGGNSWTARTPVPFARHAHGSAALGGKIYVVAGTDGGSTLSYNREYDPVSFTWADKAGLPFLRSSLGLAAATGRLYAIGGFQGSAADANEEYDPEANTWRTRAPMPGGPRYGLSVVSFGGKVYAIGGAAAGVPKNTNEAYDPAANSWTTHTTMSTAREGVTAAVVNGRIYVMGGSAGGFSDKNEEYDPATFFWTTKTPMPSPREYAAAAAVGGKIYLLGGFDGTRMASNSEYDPATNAWVQLSTMSVGRNSHAAAAAGGKIYVSGGYNVATMSLFEEFNPGVSKVFSGLQPNTLYTFKAKARNLQGSETAESLTVSTYTLAAVALMPDGNTFENVYISSVIVRWSSGTAAGGYNGPNALYVLQGSTATDFTGTLTVNQGGNPVHMESLLANTTYHFRIKAYNAGGYTDDRWLSLGSTVTHIEAPTSVYIDEVGTTSIVASAYAPGAAFTGMERGLSAVNIAKDGAYGVWGSSGNYWNTKAAMPMPRVYLAAAALGACPT